MATTSVTMRIDAELKKELQELMGNLGLDMSTFFTISAKQAVREQGIPFRVSMNVPNSETLKAMRDAENGIGLSRPFNSVSELMEDLNADD